MTTHACGWRPKVAILELQEGGGGDADKQHGQSGLDAEQRQLDEAEVALAALHLTELEDLHGGEDRVSW